MAEECIRREIRRQKQSRPGSCQRLRIIGGGNPHGTRQGVIKAPLRFFKRPTEEFGIIRANDQTTRTLEAILGKTLDQDRVLEPQLAPIRFNTSDQDRIVFFGR